MIISVTETGQFKRCRRMWDFASFNRQGLTPISNRPALQLGSLVHLALADWLVNPEADAQSLCMQHASSMVDEIKADYVKQIGAPISEVELTGVYDNLNLAYDMVGNYALHWGSPLPDGYKLISPEQTIIVPIWGTEHWECEAEHVSAYPSPFTIDWADEQAPLRCSNNDCTLWATWQPVYLEGTLDAFVQNEFGTLFILERKTYGNRPKLEKLSFEDQFVAYCWILSQLDIGPVGGVLYDGLWKRNNKPVDECFMRHLILFNADHIAEFNQQIHDIALDMLNSPAIYTNRRWEGCYDCLFERPCAAKSKGEDYDYVIRTYYKERARHSWADNSED